MAKKPGIGFVSPSGQVLDEAALARAADYFKAHGWRVVLPAAARRVHHRFAGSDAVRLDALHAMAGRDDVELIMATRGGYGLSRLLGALDYARLATCGKRFVGHSDFTALLCAGYAHGRMAGIAGPTACYDFGAAQVSAFTEAHFWRTVLHRPGEITVPCDLPRQCATGEIAGRLWGGNLALVAHLAGTPYMPRIGGLLFLEDINEAPYRIERLLYQLLHAGVLARQRAILLGDFSHYQLAPNDNGFDFDAVVAQLRSVLRIPVLTGLPFGHIRDKLSLPFAGRARLAIGRREYRLRY